MKAEEKTILRMHNSNIIKDEVINDQNEEYNKSNDCSPCFSKVVKNIVMPDTEEKMILSTSDYTPDNSPFNLNSNKFDDLDSIQVINTYANLD